MDGGEVADALSVAREGLALHPSEPDLHDILAGGLDYEGQVREALDLCVETARMRLDGPLAGHRGRVPRRTRLTPRQRLFVAGYFYSGSGAVVDGLLGRPGVVKWTEGGELRLIKGPGGFGDIARRRRTEGRLTTQDLVDHYLHLVGAKVRGLPRGTYDPWRRVNTVSRRLLRDPAGQRFVRVCLEAFLDLVTMVQKRPTRPERKLVRRFRSTIDRALRCAAVDSEADVLVLDQTIPAHRLRLACFVPPSRFIVVHRDPRDQYSEVVEATSRPGWRTRTPEQFIEEYRHRREQAEKRIPDLERRYGHAFLQVAFEDFVVEHRETAGRILGFLDLEDAGSRLPLGDGRFEPSESRMNVGKHREFLDPETVTRLEQALPEYLSPLAEAP